MHSLEIGASLAFLGVRREAWEHPLGLTDPPPPTVVNLGKPDFLLVRINGRQERDQVRECQRWEEEME